MGSYSRQVPPEPSLQKQRQLHCRLLQRNIAKLINEISQLEGNPNTEGALAKLRVHDLKIRILALSSLLAWPTAAAPPLVTSHRLLVVRSSVHLLLQIGIKKKELEETGKSTAALRLQAAYKKRAERKHAFFATVPTSAPHRRPPISDRRPLRTSPLAAGPCFRLQRYGRRFVFLARKIVRLKFENLKICSAKKLLSQKVFQPKVLSAGKKNWPNFFG